MAARALASASIAPPVPAAVRCLRRSKASKPALFATSNGTINKTTAMMGKEALAGRDAPACLRLRPGVRTPQRVGS